MATCFEFSTTFRGRPAEYELREVPENYSYWVLLVVVTDDMDLARLATHARRLQGTAQHVNCGADVFLADGKVRTSGAPAIGRIADRAFAWRAMRYTAAVGLTCTTTWMLSDFLRTPSNVHR